MSKKQLSYILLTLLFTFSSQRNLLSTETKIMCIGDSITDGYGTEGSYRKFLYNLLVTDGYTIDMVGPNNNYDSATYSSDEENFTYDPAHCGYSAYSIKAYGGRNGILETIKNGNYVSEYKPNVVILQIGTNDVIDKYDIENAGNRLKELAEYILENISDESLLFITTIPNLDPNRADVYSWFGNYRHSDDWSTKYDDDVVEKNVQKIVDNYNNQVKNVVEKLNENGHKNVYFGDVNSAISNVKTQLKDGVHPNDIGYKLMGQYWFEYLLPYLRK